MKRSFLIIGIAFVITLALVFGLRASADAMAVVIGVILGVAAGIPTTLLILFVLMRQHGKPDPSVHPSSQPPVIVINAGDKPQAYTPQPPALLPAPNSGRKWTVIGDTQLDD
jgi:hypothetical protein